MLITPHPLPTENPVHVPCASPNCDELAVFASRSDTPKWLVEATQALLARDPVKAANEAEVLAQCLRLRADRILSESLLSRPHP